MTKIAIAASTVLFFAALFEGMSALFWTQYGAARIAYHEQVDEQSVAFGKVDYNWRNSGLKSDVELGWITNPQNPAIAPNGARRAGIGKPDAKVFAYGDSFVYGADVKDDETFPYVLSQKIGAGVANFGVNGYGPDQAILRLERHLSLGHRPRMVVLGMPSENIARVVNIYRRYYIPLENPELAKPVFVRQHGVWKLVNVPSMIGDPGETRESIANVVKALDYWHGQNLKRPKFEFPFSIATLKAARFFAFDVKRWQDIYQVPRARQTMSHLLGRFVDLSLRYDFVPVFVIVPMPEDLLRVKSGGVSFFSEFLTEVSQKNHDRLIVVNLLDSEFEFARFHVRPFSGHASAYGNNVIAEAIRVKVETALPDLAAGGHRPAVE